MSGPQGLDQSPKQAGLGLLSPAFHPNFQESVHHVSRWLTHIPLPPPTHPQGDRAPF